MAKKKTVNKTQAVRDYLKDHPKATSGEIAAALNKQGIKITMNYAANIKTTLKKTRTTKKAAKRPTKRPAKRVAAVEAAAPAVVEKPMKNGDTFTLAQVKAVAQTVKTIGGVAHLNGLLDLIKEVGGLKKFKDLAEAMMVPETGEIPF